VTVGDIRNILDALDNSWGQLVTTSDDKKLLKAVGLSRNNEQPANDWRQPVTSDTR